MPSFSDNFKIENDISPEKTVRDTRPLKCKGLYVKESNNYRIVCNFAKGTSFVVGPESWKILDLCDGKRTIRQIWDRVLSTQDDLGIKGLLGLAREKSLFQIIDSFRRKRGQVSFREVARTINILKRSGAIECNSLKAIPSRGVLPLELSSQGGKLFVTFGMPEIAIKKLEVSVFFDDLFLSGYGEYSKEFREASSDLPQELVEIVYNFARENEIGGIFFKFFAGKKETLSLAKEAFRLCKEKGVEEFVETSLHLFTQWDLITPELLKELRQMSSKLLFSLDGIEESYGEKAGREFQEVKNAIKILNKERFPFFVIVPITDENIGGMKKTISFLSARKIPFALHMPLPFQDNSKILDLYAGMCRKNTSGISLSNLLGRNFKFPRMRKYIPRIIYYNNSNSLMEEPLLQREPNNLEACTGCVFKDLCSESFPLRVNYASQKSDNLSACCDIYKNAIPLFLEREIKNHILKK